MGRKCSVEGCLSDSNRQEDIGVTFHKVPLHPDVRPKWISLCHIPEDKKLVKIIYVCSRHFLRADFCNFKGKKYMLKQGVLPSVFPWDKSKLEAIKAEANIKKEPALEEFNFKETKKEYKTLKEETKLEPKSELIEDNVLETRIKHEVPGSQFKVEPKETLDEFEKTKITNENSSKFTINSRIEALDFNNEWYTAKIVEVDYEENEVLIHFENYSNKYDEWISMNSPRLRVLQEENTNCKEQFVVGERCLAAWSYSRKFPATVTKVMEGDSYEVLFDDGFVKILKAHRISKSSPLFDPIKSSKQDRREKKRKINVAQLFKKKPRLSHPEGKPKKPFNSDNLQNTLNISNNSQDSDISQVFSHEADEQFSTNNENGKSTQNWKIQWINGKPVGTNGTLETQDGVKDSIIVSDPRLPDGWNKHLLKRTQGQYAGKWDAVIVSPDYRRFRSRFEVKKYLDENYLEGVSIDMFDFALGLKKRKSAMSIPKQTIEAENPTPEEPAETTEAESETLDTKEEENANSLKIIYEDDAYKCPIEGCGKTFRRENLAQMHVKHYHPEYTKYLDSTPNVADLAYARTVGERLDSSPGASRISIKPTIRTSTPKSKVQQTIEGDINESKTPTRINSPTIPKTKDSEIIKLLNSKPYDKNESESIKPLPSGLPTNMYPEINLKDLLTKTEGVPKRDDLNLKTLCSSRPPTGIKTLLPVRHMDPSGAVVSEEPPKSIGKRKRGYSENVEIIKGKNHTHQLVTNQPQQVTIPLPPSSTPPTSPHPQQTEISPQIPCTSSTSTSQPDRPNDIIIEGGEVIKIVRMKQEEIINCTCGFSEEDGLMIQCELCLCWQHAYCNNIERESQVPEKYICYICQNPLRERLSRKFYHDQDWLKQGMLPVGSYHTKDEQGLQHRFDKLKKCNDLCGGLLEIQEYLHSLALKMKIAESKNHPKLYLWSKSWEKFPLPEKINDQDEEKIAQTETGLQEFGKDDEKSDQNESMLMMILKAGKEVIPKLDLNTLMDTSGPIIPQPEAAIDSADCKLNILEHIIHQESLVEERLNDFERQLDALEEGMNLEVDHDYPKTRQTLQMLMRDLDTVKEFSQSTTI